MSDHGGDDGQLDDDRGLLNSLFLCASITILNVEFIGYVTVVVPLEKVTV